MLQRYQNALPTIELFQRRLRLEPVADAPVLAADFDAKLYDARQKREIARNKLIGLKADRDGFEQQLRDEPPPETVLAEEGEIDALKKLVGVDANLQSEKIKADTRRSEEEGKARDIFRELTGTTAWDQMPGLKPRRDDEQRITELANEQAAVFQDVTSCDSGSTRPRGAESRPGQASRNRRTNGPGTVASRCGVHRGAGAGRRTSPNPP